MKSAQDITAYGPVVSAIGGFTHNIQQMDKVCDLIDPYLNGFAAILETRPVLPVFRLKEVFIGIHLAFWIMEDELRKMPTDPVVMSALMQKCFDTLYMDEAQRIAAINAFDYVNLNEQEKLWLASLLLFKSENYSLVFALMWTLAYIWEHTHAVDEMHAALRTRQ